MKNLKIRKYIIIFVCISFLSSVSLFLFAKHDNNHINCKSIQCSACLYINQVIRELNYLEKVGFSFLVGIVVIYGYLNFMLDKYIVAKKTLVILKVRLNN